MFAKNYGEKISVPLLKECGHSQVLVEQYLDFFVNRAFRQSLLVHGERAPQISYELDRSRFARLHFAASLPPADGESRLDASAQDYGEPDRSPRTIRSSRQRSTRSPPAGRGRCRAGNYWIWSGATRYPVAAAANRRTGR